MVFKAVSIAITTRWKVWQWVAFDNHVIFAVPTQAPSYLFGIYGFVWQGYVQMRRKESVWLYQSHIQTRRHRYVFLCDRKIHRGLVLQIYDFALASSSTSPKCLLHLPVSWMSLLRLKYVWSFVSQNDTTKFQATKHRVRIHCHSSLSVRTYLPDQMFTSCIRTIRTSTHPVVWHPAWQNCICGGWCGIRVHSLQWPITPICGNDTSGYKVLKLTTSTIRRSLVFTNRLDDLPIGRWTLYHLAIAAPKHVLRW